MLLIYHQPTTTIHKENKMSIKTSNVCPIQEHTKVTANEAAKLCIMEALENAMYSSEVDWDSMTDRERSQVMEQIQKRIESVRRSLGMNKVYGKILSRPQQPSVDTW
jgi:acyl-CoA reductase-like NAD-dependent aldehyde dehydrogenase